MLQQREQKERKQRDGRDITAWGRCVRLISCTKDLSGESANGADYRRENKFGLDVKNKKENSKMKRSDSR